MLPLVIIQALLHSGLEKVVMEGKTTYITYFADYYTDDNKMVAGFLVRCCKKSHEVIEVIRIYLKKGTFQWSQQWLGSHYVKCANTEEDTILEEFTISESSSEIISSQQCVTKDHLSHSSLGLEPHFFCDSLWKVPLTADFAWLSNWVNQAQSMWPREEEKKTPFSIFELNCKMCKSQSGEPGWSQ